MVLMLIVRAWPYSMSIKGIVDAWLEIRYESADAVVRNLISGVTA